MKGRTPLLAPVRHLLPLAVAALLVLAGCSRIEIRDKRWRWSTAGTGLALREGPGVQYDRIDVIPYGEKVRLIDVANPPTTLDGRAGRWNKILYKGLLGYGFDAYLSEEPPEESVGSGEAPVVISPKPPPTLLDSEPEKDSHQSASALKPLAGETPEPAPSDQEPEQAPEKPVVKQAAPPPQSKPPAKAAAAVSSSENRRNEPQAESGTTPRGPDEFAHAVHNSRSPIKIDRSEFTGIAETLRNQAKEAKYAYRSIPGSRGEEESIEDYLQRVEDAKRLFLKKLRQEEHAAASRVYSIYDAPLEIGSYDPTRSRFDWLGTSVPIDKSGRVVTLPGKNAARHRFVIGRKYGVEVPHDLAGKLNALQDRILVRIDFSFAVILQNLFDWTLQAYFLPRYLALYDAETGRLYYECRTLQRIEIPDDPAAPLRISSRLVDETMH